MRRRVLFLTGAGIGLALFGLVVSHMDRLIWNRTGSAPQGLYWLSDEPFTPGRWVVVSARSDEAQWVEDHGFDWRGCKVLGPDEFFLLTPHPDSLDGRYFGAMERSDLMGVAIPLLISDE